MAFPEAVTVMVREGIWVQEEVEFVDAHCVYG